MKIGEYFYSKLPYLIMNLIIYLFIFVILRITDVDVYVEVLLFLIWFMPLLIYLIIDCFRKKRFYDSVFGVMNNLDKKYLMPEVINKPNSFEEILIYELLQDSNRAMHENVAFYKHLQSEYREYIEAWVHEIKTPIASAKMVLENDGDKVLLELDMDKIQGYVDQALYYSRSTDVSNDYIIKKFNLEESIKNVIRKNRREFIVNKISIEMEEVNKDVVTDKKWIEFIINQIVINAINYRKGSNDKLKFYTKSTKENLILFIEDNGIGISNGDILRVFNKGFTGENGRKYGKSTGIGLYLCKKLCEKLGLSIDIWSIKNEGTKVSIIFPNSSLMDIK